MTQPSSKNQNGIFPAPATVAMLTPRYMLAILHLAMREKILI